MPGYFRPTKEWDLLVVKDGKFVAAIEAKLLQGPGRHPLLAVHRIKSLEKTDRRFEFPVDHDFKTAFNQEFGVIKQKSIQVELEAWGWAAHHIIERCWSPDQKIKEQGEGKIRISFSASSEPELIGWILWLGPEAKLLKPKRLAAKVRKVAAVIAEIYEK